VHIYTCIDVKTIGYTSTCLINFVVAVVVVDVLQSFTLMKTLNLNMRTMYQ
jgi:hypothetical protein